MGIDLGKQYLNDVDIVNAALAMTGAQLITSFNEDDDNARSASALYTKNRNMLLRKIPWNFARAFIALSQLAALPLNLDIISPADRGTGSVTYTGAFQLPNDCLRVYRFSPKDANWRLVGRALYTDAVPVVNPSALLGAQPPNANGSNVPAISATGSPVTLGIEYIRQILDPKQFDTLFCEALIARMKMDMAFGVVGLSEIVKSATEEYHEAISEAASVNGMENWPDPGFDTTLVDVRMGYTSIAVDS